MTAAAVVVAAGRGERLGADVPKALVPVQGRPLVVHAVGALLAAGLTHVVVVHPPGAQATFEAVLEELRRSADQLTLVAGGAARSDSVRAGLAALDPSHTVVAVHDAARGLQPPDVIAATVAAVEGQVVAAPDGRVVSASDGRVVAAAPALPVTDTVKRVEGRRIVATVDRSTLVGIQTPQVVEAALLRAVHEAVGDATDDLGLVEAHLAAADDPSDRRVVHVPGSPLGRKVTYPEDVATLESLLAQR